MIQAIRRFFPESWINLYHAILAKIAAFWYGYPSEKMVVIGVTGTNGKTTTAYLIAKALEADGSKTGCATTALFKVADREWLNATKMTMLGRFALQKLLRQMVDAGCKYAVIETSSQGIVQHRHESIAYDIGVFTNLTPEHIEAHRSFENYKRAKIKLFEHIARLPLKVLEWQRAPRALVLNRDDEHASDFAVPGIREVVWYGLGEGSGLRVIDINETAEGVSFRCVSSISPVIPSEQRRVEESGSNQILRQAQDDRQGGAEDDGITVHLKFMGRVNVYNALAALAVAKVCGQDLVVAASQLSKVENMPGRFEKIDEGQPWTVIVDYAPEPASLTKLYETIEILHAPRIIHVLGSCGGGRDVSRRPVLGRMAASKADVVIVTNEDPYDDDPQIIIDQVAQGAREAGKLEGQNLFLIIDRQAAIDKAMELAKPGDLVLLTGKGCEQRICVAGGRKIPWDERVAARQAIHRAIAPSAVKA